MFGDELCLATADQVIDDGQCVSPGLARNGHVDSVAQCPLIGAKRKTFARVELFRFWHQTDMVDLEGDVRSRRNSGSRIRWVRKNRDQKGLFDRTKRLFVSFISACWWRFRSSSSNSRMISRDRSDSIITNLRWRSGFISSG